MDKLRQFAKNVLNYITTPDHIFVGSAVLFLFLILIGC